MLIFHTAINVCMCVCYFVLVVVFGLRPYICPSKAHCILRDAQMTIVVSFFVGKTFTVFDAGFTFSFRFNIPATLKAPFVLS